MICQIACKISVIRQWWNADNISHGQGKPQNGQGNVREKSGNFVRAHGWTPWFSFKKIHLKMLFGKWHPFCLGLNLLSKIHAFSFNKMHLKMLSAKWQQFCLASLWYIVGIYPTKYVHSFVVLCFVMMRLSVLIGYISVVYPSSSGSWFNMKMSSYQ